MCIVFRSQFIRRVVRLRYLGGMGPDWNFDSPNHLPHDFQKKNHFWGQSVSKELPVWNDNSDIQYRQGMLMLPTTLDNLVCTIQPRQ